MPPKRKAAARGAGDADADAPAAKKTSAGSGEVDGRKLRWEWEADGGRWMQYSSSISNDLTDAYINKNDQIVVNVAPKVTTLLQPKKMVQKNKKTGYERRLRIATMDSANSEYYVWQWEDEHGKWNPFSTATSLELEEARDSKKDSVEFEVCHRLYKVDLAKMEQLNTTTDVKRKVSRTKSDAVAADGENDTPSTSSSASTASVKKEEEEEPAAKKGRGRGKSATKPADCVKKEEKEEEEEPEVKKGKSRGKSAAKSAKKAENGEGETKSVVRKVTISKGSAPVDAECPKVETAHVYEAGKVIWDCMLNQTNIGNNNNKYYVIQLLEDNKKKEFYVWQRWGRVGYKGQTNLVNSGGDLGKAQQVFSKKFRDKTGNDWSSKDFFCKYPGKYDLVQLDYSAEEEDQVDAAATPEDEGDKKIPDSKLDAKLQELIKMICDVKSMEEAVVEMKYDAKKAPLGKLTKQQIKEGYESLKAIEELINAKDFGRKLTDACSEFYTRIPHDFGMRVPPLIRTPQEVKEKLQLLEALEDIQYAIKMLKEGDKSENAVDRHYHALACDLEPVDHNADDFKLIDTYLQMTHATTHNMYKMKLLDLFDVQKHGEKESFQDYGNRMLLWHGSRLTNWAGILGQGLRIAPPEAPVTGYMFGKGVYFADMSSKSANYCFASRQKNVGLMLLCDVSLGNINDKLDADYHADKLPAGKHSVKGCGSVGPDPKTYKTLPDGLVVPVGKGTDTGVKNPKGFTLNYNEFIVYDTRQIRMRYLVKVQFNFK